MPAFPSRLRLAASGLLCAIGFLATSAQAQPKPIVIGASVAQTGVASQFDIPPMQMVRVAIETINEKGGVLGRPLKLVTADTASKVEQGRVAARQVIAAGAEMMLVTCDFDFGSPAALAAQEAGVVVFSLCAQSWKFGVQGIGPLAYTAAPASHNEGAVLAEFAASRASVKQPFMLIDNTIAYDVEVCDGFRTRWKSRNGKFAGEALYKNDDATIRSQVNEILRSRADAVLICGYTPGAPSAMRQLRSAGFKGVFLAPNTLDGTFWLNTVPDISDLFVTATRSVYGDDPSPEVRVAIERHRRLFGDRPISGFALSGYAAVEAMAIAIQKAGTTEGKAVAAELNKFRKVPLLNGPTTFTTDLHINADRPMAIIQYTKGVPKYVATVDPGSVELPAGR